MTEKEKEIQQWFVKRWSLIDERNKIENKWFICLRPKMKQRALEIEMELDRIDMVIYELRTRKDDK